MKKKEKTPMDSDGGSLKEKRESKNLKIGVCLITRGVNAYFADSVRRFVNLAHENPSIKFRLVLNGCSSDVIDLVKDVFIEVDNFIYIHHKNNQIGVDCEIRSMLNEGINWGIFPSDDDLFDQSWLNHLVSLIRENPDCSAVATGAKEIDSQGRETGVRLLPVSTFKKSPIETVAHSLHEPLFVWPTTALNLEYLSKWQFPKSSYAHDWMIGIVLSIEGRIVNDASMLYRYRRHENQESAQNSNSRKFAESRKVISELLDSDLFLEWLNGTSEEDFIKFIYDISFKKPIYNSQSGEMLQDKILDVLNCSNKPSYLRFFSVFLIALGRGYLITEQEHDIFIAKSNETLTNHNILIFENFNLLEDLKCVSLLEQDILIPYFGRNLLSLQCRSHDNINSRLTKVSVIVDCRKYELFSQFEIKQSIAKAINTQLSKEFRAIEQVSAREMVILRKMRSLKQRYFIAKLIEKTRLRQYFGNS